MDEVKGHFAPELLNRIDEVVLFNRLQPEGMKGIVEAQLAKVRMLMKDKEMNLDISEAALQYLASANYSPEYGARPVIRAIQKDIMNPMATHVLQGKIHDKQTVKVRLSRRDAGLDVDGDIENIDERQIKTDEEDFLSQGKATAFASEEALDNYHVVVLPNQ